MLLVVNSAEFVEFIPCIVLFQGSSIVWENLRTTGENASLICIMLFQWHVLE